MARCPSISGVNAENPDTSSGSPGHLLDGCMPSTLAPQQTASWLWCSSGKTNRGLFIGGETKGFQKSHTGSPGPEFVLYL